MTTTWPRASSGGVIVRKGVATVRIEAPAGSVRLAVNE